MGEAVTGKMVAALKRIGFDKVFDTNFSADLTIIEEGHEFINRVKNGGTLPMITSCSPVDQVLRDILPGFPGQSVHMQILADVRCGC